MSKNSAHEPQRQLRELLLRSVREVERLRGELAARDEAIAIIGIGLRAPAGVHDLASLWQLLESEADAVRDVPRTRWDPAPSYDPDPDAVGKSYVRAAAWLDEVAGFDAAFFAISPREAKNLDPQHRLVLEAAWEALERARIVPEDRVRSRTGVFVGAGPSEYGRLQRAEDGDPYAVMGTHPSFAAGRVAFHLGLRGPALCVDTACSSSLVALHLACKALLNDECELALAGGVQVMAGPEGFVHLSSTRTVSADGRCKTFSAAADGYGRGEGVVVLALARQSVAEAAGHPILALIKGSAVNHDGASNGITAPSGSAQREVLRAALEDAGLEPADVDLVECHGTGTKLGDPIEVQALAAVYGEGRPPTHPLLIGTVKTNIGHLESASGLAGVAKILAAMRHGQIPASLHSQPLNPLVDWDTLAVEVVTARRPWPVSAARPRRAGVSAFGLSGTNVHVILEQAPSPSEPETQRVDPGPRSVPLLISGRSEAALSAQAGRLRAWLETRDKHSEAPALVDLGASLACTRQHLEHRAWVLARVGDRAGLDAALRGLEREGHGAGSGSALVGPHKPKLAFMFTGQGSQSLGMGAALYASHGSFRAAFDACCLHFDAALGHSLRELIFAAPGSALGERLGHTQITQPALFCVEVALFRLLESWGLRPDLLIGHSIGELIAAHLAGVFSLADACKLVAARARLMQSLPGVAQGRGAMLAIAAPEAEVLRVLIEGVEIAGVNAPDATVISGDQAGVTALAAHFEALGIQSRRLQVSHAFHSHHMDPIMPAFEAVARTLDYRAPELTMVSNLSGAPASAEELCHPEYWVRHLREPVRFGAGIEACERAGVTVLLELGPHAALTPMAHASLSPPAQDRITIAPTMRRAKPELETLIAALCRVHGAGVALDWGALFEPFAAKLIDLPTYAFTRQHHWLEAAREGSGLSRATRSGARPGDYALAGQRVELHAGVIVHSLEIGPQLQPYLGDHVVYGRLVVPGSFHLALLLAVAHAQWPGRALELREVEFLRALAFSGRDDQRTVHVELGPSALDVDRGQGLSAFVFSVEQGERVELARATLAPLAREQAEALEAAHPPVSAGDPREPKRLEQALELVEIEWGPLWWWLREVEQISPDTAAGRFAPAAGVTIDDAPLPCGFIDNSFGLQAWAREDEAGDRAKTAQLPFGVERLVWYGHGETPALAQLRCDTTAADSTHSSLLYWDARGRPLAQMHGFATRRAPRERLLQPRVAAMLQRLAWRAVASVDTQPELEPHTIVDLGPQTDLRATWAGARAEDLAALQARLERAEAAPALLTRVVMARSSTPLAASTELLELVQGWLADPRLARTGLAVITRGAVSVDAREGVEDLSAAPVWGLIRAAASEHPQRSLTLIDLDGHPDSAACLGAALASAHPQIALRAGVLLVPRLERAASPSGSGEASGSGESGPSTWAQTGTTLITGASGQLGTALARHLVLAHGARRLILVSRRGAAASGTEALRTQMQAAGAELEFLACDIADHDALAAVLATIPASCPLRAVFHCAGVLDDATVATSSPAHLEQVFRAKIDGAAHLHALTAELELAVFVLFSSASGILGAPGQSNYAAANTYLDALAGTRRALGLPGLALAWGPWSGAGMAAEHGARLRRQGVRPLAPAAGLALLDLALVSDDAMLVPVDLDLDRLADRREQGEFLTAILDELVAGRRSPRRPRAGGPRVAAQLRTLSGEARALALHELVHLEVAAVLELAPTALEPERDLRDYGLDSLMAIELRNRLQRASGVSLPSTLVLDHSTCAALVAHVLGHLETAAPHTQTNPGAQRSDQTQVWDYLELQSHQTITQAHGGRQVYALLDMLTELIHEDLGEGIAALEQSLLTLRRLRDKRAPTPEPTPVCLSRPDAPRCVYAIPAFGWPSSPLQFVRIAAAFEAQRADPIGIWSAANPGIEVGVALPASLAGVVDYHVATYLEIVARTGLRPALMGFSSGGWLAMRVAARLEAQGTSAPRLAFLDSSHPFETPPKAIKHMFVGNAIEHHAASGGDDDVFIHELTGMLWLMKITYGQWTEVELQDTPALHLASVPGFNFPRWELVFSTDPKTHWGPFIRDLSVEHSEIEHYQMITLGAEEFATRVCAWWPARDTTPSTTSA